MYAVTLKSIFCLLHTMYNSEFQEHHNDVDQHVAIKG